MLSFRPSLTLLLYSDLAEKLIENYLFPNLSEESDNLIVPQIPVMHTQTRQELYGILSLLCKYSEDYCTVVDCVKELIPGGTNSSSWHVRPWLL
jgi:ubiquitin carboxyl-terminal hydrolase 34